MTGFRVSALFFWFALAVGCTGGSDIHSSNSSSVSGGGGGTSPTSTVNFPYSDFNGVSISAPFVISIVPGEFSIQVTVDSSVVDLLAVSENGQVLEIGFQPGHNIRSDTLAIEISMPALQSVSLAGVAFATIHDFSGPVLDVQLAGVATLDGQNVSYDLLMANVSAVSVLLMEDARPFPVADVNVLAVSSATVNMMDSGILTGSAVATSSLAYYGSNVSVMVTTDLTSSVNRLGDSRP
jgi:hypothetical protein